MMMTVVVVVVNGHMGVGKESPGMNAAMR